MLTLDQMEDGQDVTLDITLSEYDDEGLLHFLENPETLKAILPPLVGLDVAQDTLSTLIKERATRNFEDIQILIKAMSLKNLRHLVDNKEAFGDFCPAFVAPEMVKELLRDTISLEIKRKEALKAKAAMEAKARYMQAKAKEEAEIEARVKAEKERVEEQALEEEEEVFEEPVVEIEKVTPTPWYMSLFSRFRT